MVWAVIPLVLIGIVGMQESFAKEFLLSLKILPLICIKYVKDSLGLKIEGII
ncbi:MAG: hypothetical protein HRO68_06340 [Nitrosopumilus sp.]|nr:hypothetical protein [Nitrosopumilus sp.]